MNIWIKRCLEAGVIGGGLWLLGTGLASAQGIDHGAQGQGLLTAPVNAPITVCGNGIGLFGHASASCGSSSTSGTGATGGSKGSTGRSLISVPVTAPVTVCGNAAGRASAGCTATGPAGSTAGSGTVADLPMTAPVTVCGNGAGVLGNSSASCANQTGSSSAGATSGGSSSGGSSGVTVPVTAPVTACGNGVGLLGSATASCSGSSSSAGTPPAGSPPGTSGGSTTGGSAIIGITAHQAAVRSVLALRSSEQPDSLAFTGSSLRALTGLAAALLIVGAVLSGGWRRRAC